MEPLQTETTVFSMSTEPPAPRNRRSGDRHMTLFRVAALVTPAGRELCLLKNLSAGGALIRAYSDLRESEKVELELKERQKIAGEVSWVRGSDAGIRFDRHIDVLRMLSVDADGAKPRMPRIEVRAFAIVRQGAVLHRAVLSNISQGGLNVECSANLSVGGEVTVSLPGLPPQQAVVRWQEPGCCGIRFNSVLALPVLVEWLRSRANYGEGGT